jgi:metal-dependent amidase/aminoacylase/carboxypeptidase family protein
LAKFPPEIKSTRACAAKCLVAPRRIRLSGTLGEEDGSGKVYMVRDGLFNDADVALHGYGDDENSAAGRTTLANRSGEFRFSGVPAYAADDGKHNLLLGGGKPPLDYRK